MKTIKLMSMLLASLVLGLAAAATAIAMTTVTVKATATILLIPRRYSAASHMADRLELQPGASELDGTRCDAL